MNTTTTRQQRQMDFPGTNRSAATTDSGYEQLVQAESMIEHLTIPGFLRRIPHRWHLDDITRFGDKVGRAAESMQLAYLTTVDRSLGVIRIFPLPFLQRVYDIMSVQFNWPKIIESAPQLEDPRKARQETLRAHERLEKHLRALLDVAQNSEVQHSIAMVVHWVESDIQRLREELGENGAASAACEGQS